MRWYERILYFFHGSRVEKYGYGEKGQFVCHANRVDVIFNSKEAAELYDFYGIDGFEVARNRGFKL